MRRRDKTSRLVGVLMGGLSAERDVSLQSGKAVLAALQERGYPAVAIDVGRDLCRQLLAEKIDVAYIALHGKFGEDGCVQGLLETMRIPYTGAGVRASAVAMDKVISKRLFEAVGLPVVPWCFPATVDAIRALGLPVVVKPRDEGSSVGLTVVREIDQAAEALEKAGGAQSAMVERYVAGRELSVGVLGSGHNTGCLGTVEIRPKEGLYDYEAKYLRDDTEYLVPAPLTPEMTHHLSDLAVSAHRVLECSGATRVDFLWDGQGDPLVLELNTIPGMTSHSLLPKIAAFSGLDYGDLVEAVLDDASLKTH